MEVTSYIGFKDYGNFNTVKNRSLKHFTSFFRKSEKNKFSFNSSSPVLNAGVFSQTFASVSSSTIIEDKQTLWGYLKNISGIIGRNVSNILNMFQVLGISFVFSFLMINALNFISNYTGPVVLKNTGINEINMLNKVMAAFALDETSEFTSDGTLIDLDSSETSPLIAQPVEYKSYTVQTGDTVSGIAKKFGLRNISTLLAVNDIDNARQLASGQKLKIPSIDGLVYTVQPNNSLAGISAKFGVALEDILDVNELESERISAGQQLFIPGAKLDEEKLRQILGNLFLKPISAKYRLTSSFGARADPFTGTASFHTGIDMACPTGTPIAASASGTVSFVGFSNIFGNYVIINHSGGYQTLYGHMSKIIAKKGQRVSQGTRIGLVGSTGYSTGPHLHFTVYKNGKLVDPLSVMK